MAKKMITLKGDSTKWYEKVIFVIDKDEECFLPPMDLIREAEFIINEYVKKTKEPKCVRENIDNTKKVKKNKNDAIDKFLFFSITFCLIAMTYMIVTTV